MSALENHLVIKKILQLQMIKEDYQEQIDEMISNSEKYKEEDDKIKLKIEARNDLENYLYSFKNSINESEKLDEDTKKEGLEMLDKELNWLDENDDADTEEYKNKKNECEEKMKPIVAKMYEGTGMDSNMDANEVPTSVTTSPDGQVLMK